jgi:hypothetical protein
MSNHQQELINNSLGIHLRMVMDENKKFRLQLKAVREIADGLWNGPDGSINKMLIAGYIFEALDGEQDG